MLKRLPFEIPHSLSKSHDFGRRALLVGRVHVRPAANVVTSLVTDLIGRTQTNSDCAYAISFVTCAEAAAAGHVTTPPDAHEGSSNPTPATGALTAADTAPLVPGSTATAATGSHGVPRSLHQLLDPGLTGPPTPHASSSKETDEIPRDRRTCPRPRLSTNLILQPVLQRP